jgi:hypothetical protein
MRLEIVDTLTITHTTRELYVFEFYTARGFTLVQYRQQTRASRRHKWIGPSWDYYDVRSSLNKPAVIPSHVIEDARLAVNRAVYQSPVKIGWR